MLVTFKCDVYAHITYFGDVAKSLLKMMGHSGTIPGAIMAEDVPRYLERLKNEIDALKGAAPMPDASPKEESDWKEKSVTLAHRALPLIELLTAAAKAKSNVMWEQN